MCPPPDPKRKSVSAVRCTDERTETHPAARPLRRAAVQGYFPRTPAGRHHQGQRTLAGTPRRPRTGEEAGSPPGTASAAKLATGCGPRPACSSRRIPAAAPPRPARRETGRRSSAQAADCPHVRLRGLRPEAHARSLTCC